MINFGLQKVTSFDVIGESGEKVIERLRISETGETFILGVFAGTNRDFYNKLNRLSSFGLHDAIKITPDSVAFLIDGTEIVTFLRKRPVALVKGVETDDIVKIFGGLVEFFEDVLS